VSERELPAYSYAEAAYREALLGSELVVVFPSSRMPVSLWMSPHYC